MPAMDRMRIDQREEDIGMTSFPIWIEGYGEAPDADGFAPSAELGFYIENPIELLPESRQDQIAGDALVKLLDTYEGISYDSSGLYPGPYCQESIAVTFGADYLEGEDTDALIERIDRTTGFNRLYNEAGIFYTFAQKFFESLGLSYEDLQRALHPSESPATPASA